MEIQRKPTRSPEKAANVLLIFIVLTGFINDDLEYSRTYHKDSNMYQDVLHGTALAPAQYRIAILKIADFLGRHSPLPMRHWLSLIGVVCSFVAVFSLFYLLRRSTLWQQTSLAGRWFGALTFAFLVEYYFGWITYYQRPETLPTAAFVALTLLFISVPLSRSKTIAAVAGSSAIIALAAAQGFIRADAALAMSAGVIFLCLTRSATGLALDRVPQIIASVFAGGIAFAIQYYLMHVVYPQAVYGDTPMIQLLLNLKSPLQWITFTLFMLPPVWTIYQVLFGRATVDSNARAMVYAATCYLALWLTFGRMEEERIYLPFALALAPCTVAVAVQRLLPSPVQSLASD